ncbi:unnamed protein product [Heligmosomoides polygyrus]|uniref:glucuronosyltransferase n=1 Tax=Heligmosomoides polygyrus TaxID=6339 RepID=A0A183GNQ7_HELPZ|nr:unnamed protein product [Heligmosomoides polygyrus]
MQCCFSFFDYQKTASSALTDMPSDLLGPFPKTNDVSASKTVAVLLEFVSDPKSKGTIVVAFGTVINWGRVPTEKFSAVLDALNSFSDYRIVWGYNGRDVEMKPHIYASKWIPQVDVLHDSRTVLFFSHGGLKSLKEATCSSVPSVFMPMFAEQVRNGWMAKSRISNPFWLLPLDLRHALNFSFATNAGRITAIFNDKVVHPLVNGVHHVNRLLKYGGRMPEYFYPRAITRDYLSHLNVDIIVIPVLTVITISF